MRRWQLPTELGRQADGSTPEVVVQSKGRSLGVAVDQLWHWSHRQGCVAVQWIGVRRSTTRRTLTNRPIGTHQLATSRKLGKQRRAFGRRHYLTSAPGGFVVGVSTRHFRICSCLCITFLHTCTRHHSTTSTRVGLAGCNTQAAVTACMTHATLDGINHTRVSGAPYTSTLFRRWARCHVARRRVSQRCSLGSRYGTRGR